MVRRARIVLLSADRVGMMAITRAGGMSKVTVSRRQERDLAKGIARLFRNRSRSVNTRLGCPRGTLCGEFPNPSRRQGSYRMRTASNIPRYDGRDPARVPESGEPRIFRGDSTWVAQNQRCSRAVTRPRVRKNRDHEAKLIANLNVTA
jgi:hypothetical protein